MAEIINTQVNGVNKSNSLFGNEDIGQLDNDMIATLNALMDILVKIQNKMRDITRQMEQSQTNAAFKAQVQSFNIQMEAIEKISGAAKQKAIAGIVSGCLALGVSGAGLGLKMDGLMNVGSTLDKTVGSIAEFHTNEQDKKGQEEKSLSDFVRQSADALEKSRADYLSQAERASSLMREFLTTLVQAHDRMSSHLKI